MPRSDDTVRLACQAEGCSASPDFACDALVMTPPTRGFLPHDLMLCKDHATEFERTKRLSVVLDSTNPDMVSVAQWWENSGSDPNAA